YALRVGIEGGIKLSNKPIELKLTRPITAKISATNNIRCDNGNEILIKSSVTDDHYDYSWFRNGVELTEKGTTLSTNLTGKYQLEITAFGCTLSSNTFIVEELSSSVVQLNVSDVVVILEGQSKTITASGGDSYQWFEPKNELIGSASNITIQEDGEYTLVDRAGECQVTKRFNGTNLESYVIAYVMTPNGFRYNAPCIISSTY